MFLLGGSTAQGVECAVTGEGVLATQLKGVADAAARADGVVSTPAVVAFDGVLGRQGAVALDGVLWAQGALVVQREVTVAVTAVTERKGVKSVNKVPSCKYHKPSSTRLLDFFLPIRIK